MVEYFLPTNRLENRTSGRGSNVENGGQRMDPMEGTKKGGSSCNNSSKPVTVLVSHCTLLPMFTCYDVLLVTFSKCQSRWHVTVSTSYIKWTAFLVIVVARIPLRQSSFDYD